VQADGKIIAGGSFTNIGGQPRNFLARIDPITGLVDSLNPSSLPITSISLQSDGKFLIGYFAVVPGTTFSGLVRANNDTPALQNLAVTQTAVTWTRGGSSPKLDRVTFEFSTNNANYTPLGNGTASGSNWTLTGLSLPTAQNIYIRARGFYRCGRYNGSESITESVRNAYLPPPSPLLNIQLIANTNVVLSWATNSTGFTLEATTNLTTIAWNVVTPAPAISGTNNVVTNTVSGSTRFYRLRQ
jgi:hypothetical protein